MHNEKPNELSFHNHQNDPDLKKRRETIVIDVGEDEEKLESLIQLKM